MTNSDSCGNETPTGGTTTELDVSGITDAAKILIERMKIKPEEFTPGNKFGHIWAACWQRVNPEPHTGAPPPVPLRDAEVLLAAYDKYITEPEFTQHVLETVFAEPKQEEQRTYVQGGYTFQTPGREYMRMSSSGSVGISASTSVQANSLRLGQQTLTEDLIAQMKTKLGL
jgi:hypothetical protein